eukprot:CAMPEP_0174757624 /NCGR_PEP_ID=MMETSP1094-20130205/107354_1 /TAXON_ID=156173 /ORGANISM="Chrysochromulina brevifilum, Strain UTEX LB 985" /LENGTH=121 /DNA_ID=CAMNT_0015963539 /DNA_START=532 /DNA_END=894 /DNA_ORIENTATION=-
MSSAVVVHDAITAARLADRVARPPLLIKAKEGIRLEARGFIVRVEVDHPAAESISTRADRRARSAPTMPTIHLMCWAEEKAGARGVSIAGGADGRANASVAEVEVEAGGEATAAQMLSILP